MYPEPTNWFHLSPYWMVDSILVSPQTNRIDDIKDSRDKKPSIAACPSIAQCIVALGAWQDCSTVRVYCAKSTIDPEPARWLFNYALTREHRFYQKTQFEYVGIEINLTVLAKSGHVKIRENSGLQDHDQMLKNISLTLKDLYKIFPKS